MLLTSAALGEFADKYGDHVVFASATGTGGVVATVWRVVPVEIVTLITVALFICLRIFVERWLHKHTARKHLRFLHDRGRHPAKRRTRV